MSSKAPRAIPSSRRGIAKQEQEFITPEDFNCPICLQLIIYPVTMPCQHELCLDCFQQHVQDTSLTCPICRLRISTWTRINAKANSLVNESRWKLIQERFPGRCQRRLNGEDDIDDTVPVRNDPTIVICKTGELRKEYEEELKKVRAENEAKPDLDGSFFRELAASEAVILAEAREQQELDERTARQLLEEEMQLQGLARMSPAKQQQELLNLFRPRSPRELRKRSVPYSTAAKATSRRRK